MKIEKDKRVRIKVKLQVEKGEVLEESVVEYFHGAGNMLTGLEEELEGMASGAKKSGVIPAAKAFGAPEHQHSKEVARSEFPDSAELEAGHTFVAKGENGQDVVIEVTEVTDDLVKTLLKHPLADKNIVFDAEVLSVSDPTPPPLPAEAVTEDE